MADPTNPPVPEPGGPADPDDKPPVKPKGQNREQASQENVGSSESEGQTAPVSSPETSNE